VIEKYLRKRNRHIWLRTLGVRNPWKGPTQSRSQIPPVFA